MARNVHAPRAREPDLVALSRRFLRFKAHRKTTWPDEVTGFFLAEARRKYRRYPRFLARLHQVVSSPVLVEAKTPGHASIPAGFVRESVFPLLGAWFDMTFSPGQGAVLWVDGRQASSREHVMRCQFQMHFDDLKLVEKDVVDYTDMGAPMKEREFTRFLFQAIINGLTQVIQSETKSQWEFSQLSNILELDLQAFSVSFLVSFRVRTGEDARQAFFAGNLLDFITGKLSLPLTPPEMILLEGKWLELLEYARFVYHEDREDVLDSIKHFHAKARLTGQMSHLYPVMTFIVSRLDLSLSSVRELLARYFHTREIDEKHALVLGYMFDTVSEQSMLFSTFQANISGFKDTLGNLLMIILQYYLISLDERTLSEKFFNGVEMFRKLSDMLGDKGGTSKFESRFQEFLVNHYKIQETPAYDMFIKMVFGKRVEQLLSRFFASFLKTSNVHLASIVETLVPGSLTLDTVMDFIAEFLVFGIETVFFQDKLSIASTQFKDSKSRFSEDNVAMAMLELLLYKFFPFQDNLWMAVMTTGMRETLDLAFLPSKGAIEARMKHVSRELLEQFVVHDRAEKTTTRLLHEWFLDEILRPFLSFLDFHDKHLREPGEHSVNALVRRAARLNPPVRLDATTATTLLGMITLLLPPDQ